jgi:chemotaxis protein MotB
VHEVKDEIIIKKKKSGHAGHHGGAWKVAFADFMTALMAFFMVMWLISMKKDIKVAVAAYFRDPGAFQTTKNAGVGTEAAGGSGILPGAATLKSTTGGLDGAARQAIKEAMQQASTRLKAELAKVGGMKGLEKQVEVTLTNEGMRIELLDSDESMFFDSGSSKVKGDTERLLVLIAKELAHLAKPIIVEGHTDRRPYSAANAYSNWDLSVERANAARRLMQGGGLGPDMVKEVRGYADLRLRVKENPFDARNRRVSIIVPFDGLPD